MPTCTYGSDIYRIYAFKSWKIIKHLTTISDMDIWDKHVSSRLDTVIQITVMKCLRIMQFIL